LTKYRIYGIIIHTYTHYKEDLELVRIVSTLLILIIASSVALAEEPGTEPGAVCSSKPDGVTKDYDEDGKLMTEWMCKDGHLNGITRLYYDNGELEKASSYIDDVRQGVTYGYYDTGALKSICNYKDGKLDGIHKIYRKNGDIKEYTIYKDGVNLGDGEHTSH